MFAALEGREFMKSSPAALRQVMVKLVQTVHFAKADGIGSLSMVSIVTEIKLVKRGSKAGGWIAQSLSSVFFLNRKVFTTETEILLVVTLCWCESWKTWLFISVMTCIIWCLSLGESQSALETVFLISFVHVYVYIYIYIYIYIYSYKILFCPSWNFSHFRAWE